MKSVKIGNSITECIRITVTGYERESNREFYGSNWINVIVDISSGKFSGSINASMLTFEFVDFNKQLKVLYQNLKGQAKFETIEGQLELTLVGNSSGGIELTGVMCDNTSYGNKLMFEMSLDQTYLPSVISELDALSAEYYVRE